MSELKFQPVGNQVFVKKIVDKEEKKSGSIILASDNSDSYDRGEVIAIGNGSHTLSGVCIPIPVHVGDIVRFHKFEGVEFEDNYLVLHESHLLGIEL